MSLPDPIAARVARLFEERLGIALPDQDTDLFQEGVLDSLSFVNLLFHLEREFGLVIPLEDLELDRFRSVRAIALFVAARSGGGQLGARGGQA